MGISSSSLEQSYQLIGKQRLFILQGTKMYTDLCKTLCFMYLGLDSKPIVIWLGKFDSVCFISEQA